MITDTAHSGTAAQPPLVVTITIEDAVQDYFNALRKQHFPPERNYIDAHLTLFHALPHQPRIIGALQEAASQQTPVMVTAEVVVSLGNGTAFKILSPEMAAFHRGLQATLNDVLTPQDGQKRNFHITIQNKVESGVARALQEALKRDFQPFAFAATGIQVWRYLGGPWDLLTAFPFAGKRV